MGKMGGVMIPAVNLTNFLDLQTFFGKCCALNKKCSGKFRLEFVLLDAEKVSQDLRGGIKDIKIFSNRIQFVGKLYNDPTVTIKFKNIESIKRRQSWELRQSDGPTNIIEVKAIASSIHYRIPYGSDF